MIRKIIKIDKDLCNGCSLCVTACHEGAIGMRDGKATLLRDDYCDGLGDCLPACPTNAISFVEREALPYNEEEVKRNMELKQQKHTGCPSSKELSFNRTEAKHTGCPSANQATFSRTDTTKDQEAIQSELTTWPIQLKLVNPSASFFENADLLVAADCTAFAYGNFHNDFVKGKVCIIGCPKLDDHDQKDKILQILQNNNINSVTCVRMEVPCCSGIKNATEKAIEESKKIIPYTTVVLSRDGKIL